MPEGRQSPPPERQTGQQIGSQTKNAPDSDFGKSDAKDAGKDIKSDLENLESNPKAPLDDAVKDKFAKN